MPHAVRNRRRRALLRFSLSYLSMLLIPVIMSVSVFFIASNIIKEQTVHANTLVLEQAVARLESALSEADNFAYTLMRLRAALQLTLETPPLDGQTLYTIHQTLKDLPSFTDSGGLVKRYFLYFRQGDFIIEPGCCYLTPESYYGSAFAWGNLTFPAWWEAVIRSPERNLTLPAAYTAGFSYSGSALLYCRDFVYLTRQMGKVVFYVDEARLQQLFSPLQDLSAAHTAVFSGDGQLLSASSGNFDTALLKQAAGRAPRGSYEAKMDDRAMIISYYRSGVLGWTVAAATPGSDIIAQAGNILKPLLAGMAAMVLFGLLLALTLLHGNRKPLLKTLEQLPAPTDGGCLRRGLWQLDQAVHQLVSSNDLLSRRLDEQRSELRAALIAGLENGSAQDGAQIEAILSHAGIQLDGERYRGVYLKLPEDAALDDSTLEQGDYHRTLVIELMASYAPQLHFLALKDQSCFILLLTDSEGNPCDLHRLFSGLYHSLQNTYRLDAAFYVGVACKRLRSISYSLLSARSLMLKGPGGGSFLCVAQDTPQASTGASYTDRQEQKLLVLAATAKREELMALLDQIHQKNTGERHLTQFEQQMLFCRMLNTLQNADPERPLCEELTCSFYKLDMDRFFALVRQHCLDLCEKAEMNRTLHTSRLIAQVLAYIDDHYMDYSICLSSVSLHFGLTEKYLSLFIKEKAGVHFSVYLEQLRMRKANELLESTNMTMEEIAQAIGYANSKTFRRAYCRASSTSPAAYRQAKKTVMPAQAPETPTQKA